MKARAAKIDLWQSLLIGYAVWLLPWITQWVAMRLSVKQALYECAFVLVLHGLALLVLGKVYRWATDRGLALKRAGAVALGASVPMIALAYVLDFYVTRFDPSLATPWSHTTLFATVLTALGDSTGICLLLAAVVFLPAVARDNEEHRRDLELVEREAEVLRIRSHLEPHFILNSLNAVAGLVEEDPTQARELLAALGDLFREAVGFRTTHRVEDEIGWVKRYVTIHELRYPDVLDVTWDVDEACLDTMCPALILQPLVENAIKHGALRGGGHLTVSARLDGASLLFIVEDDGPELGLPREGGQGLSITRRRVAFESAAPDAFTLVREGARTVARVRLPLRIEPGNRRGGLGHG